MNTANSLSDGRVIKVEFFPERHWPVTVTYYNGSTSRYKMTDYVDLIINQRINVDYAEIYIDGELQEESLDPPILPEDEQIGSKPPKPSVTYLLGKLFSQVKTAFDDFFEELG